jgi:hypothetical protein
VTLHEVNGLYVVCAYFDQREIFVKMLQFDHDFVTYLYLLFYIVGDACAQIVAILLVYVSMLAWYSALCIFEKHMLAFVDLIHALPTRGRKSTQFMFPGGVLHQGKKNLGQMHLFKGSLHSCIWELFFT